MNNTLTAKEWLEDKDKHYFTMVSDHQFNLMELYANYKNRMLEDRIKEFRDHIVDIPYIGVLEEKELLKEYDKHFNIENKQ